MADGAGLDFETRSRAAVSSLNGLVLAYKDWNVCHSHATRLVEFLEHCRRCFPPSREVKGLEAKTLPTAGLEANALSTTEYVQSISKNYRDAIHHIAEYARNLFLDMQGEFKKLTGSDVITHAKSLLGDIEINKESLLAAALSKDCLLYTSDAADE